jgi:hypothetical protein
MLRLYGSRLKIRYGEKLHCAGRNRHFIEEATSSGDRERVVNLLDL